MKLLLVIASLVWFIGCGKGGGSTDAASAAVVNPSQPSLTTPVVTPADWSGSYQAVHPQFQPTVYSYCDQQFDQNGDPIPDSWSCSTATTGYAYGICQGYVLALESFNLGSDGTGQFHLVTVYPGAWNQAGTYHYVLTENHFSAFALSIYLYQYQGQTIAQYGGSNSCAILYE